MKVRRRVMLAAVIAVAGLLAACAPGPAPGALPTFAGASPHYGNSILTLSGQQANVIWCSDDGGPVTIEVNITRPDRTNVEITLSDYAYHPGSSVEPPPLFDQSDFYRFIERTPGSATYTSIRALEPGECWGAVLGTTRMNDSDPAAAAPFAYKITW